MTQRIGSSAQQLASAGDGARNSLTLETARRLALVQPGLWCVVPCGCGYAVGREVSHPNRRVCLIVDQHRRPLWFPSIDVAAHFLRTQLHIHQAMVSLLADLAPGTEG